MVYLKKAFNFLRGKGDAFENGRPIMEKRIVKLYAKNNTVPLKVVPGHFATNHSHVNYYIDMTTLKTRLSEAGSVAASLAGLYMTNTIVDTIVCLDGTQVIGTLLAQELTRAGYLSMNAHGTIYVVTPEYNSNSPPNRGSGNERRRSHEVRYALSAGRG